MEKNRFMPEKIPELKLPRGQIGWVQAVFVIIKPCFTPDVKQNTL
jgi:hypothetical protein